MLSRRLECKDFGFTAFDVKRAFRRSKSKHVLHIQQLVVFNYCRNLCEFPPAYVFFLLPNWWYLLRVPVALFQNTEKIKPEKQGSVSNQMFSKNSFVTHPRSFCSN